MPTRRAQRLLNRVSRKLKTGVVAKRYAVELGNELVSLTPQDTNTAASNWFVSIASPSLEVNLKKRDLNLGGASSVLQSRREVRVLWVSNNIVYIRPLENGHSGQAPRGFVNRAIRNSIPKIESFLKEEVNQED